MSDGRGPDAQSTRRTQTAQTQKDDEWLIGIGISHDSSSKVRSWSHDEQRAVGRRRRPVNLVSVAAMNEWATFVDEVG